MSGYYGSDPSSGGSGGGGYYNAGGYGQQQPRQQQHQQSQQAQGQASFAGYGGGGGAQPTAQQWQAQPQQSAQTGMNMGGAPTSDPSMKQQQQPNLWNPATAASMMSAAGSGFSNDAMIDLASTAGKSFLQSGSARMVPGLEGAMNMLRMYFAVDNRYVKRKMQRILFPFVYKQWRRQQTESTGPEVQVQYALPNSDPNAPDLYLPFMSLITYVLLCALCYGTAGKFNPEVLPNVTTKCLGTQVLEVLAIRFGMYMMQAAVPFLDLLSYTGYKYLGLCLNMLAGLALGHLGYGQRGYYIAFVWTASAASFFMLKTMANNIPLVTAATGPKREVMVCAFAASQFATMWFVSQTKLLDVSQTKLHVDLPVHVFSSSEEEPVFSSEEA